MLPAIPPYQKHRCQHQRTKKRDRADEKARVSIFPTTRGRNLYFSTSSRRYMDFATVAISWDIFIPGPYAAKTKSQLNKQAKKHNFVVDWFLIEITKVLVCHT